MKVIIFDNDYLDEIINHFVAYGFDDFTVFAEKSLNLDLNYFSLNDIRVTVLNAFLNERSVDRLTKIKGSIEEAFFIVYSREVCSFDIDSILAFHRQGQRAVTALQSYNRLSSLVCEEEIFDFFSFSNELEREIIPLICEHDELTVISNCLNYAKQKQT